MRIKPPHNRNGAPIARCTREIWRFAPGDCGIGQSVALYRKLQLCLNFLSAYICGPPRLWGFMFYVLAVLLPQSRRDSPRYAENTGRLRKYRNLGLTVY